MVIIDLLPKSSLFITKPVKWAPEGRRRVYRGGSANVSNFIYFGAFLGKPIRSILSSCLTQTVVSPRSISKQTFFRICFTYDQSLNNNLCGNCNPSFQGYSFLVQPLVFFTFEDVFTYDQRLTKNQCGYFLPSLLEYFFQGASQLAPPRCDNCSEMIVAESPLFKGV